MMYAFITAKQFMREGIAAARAGDPIAGRKLYRKAKGFLKYTNRHKATKN